MGDDEAAAVRVFWSAVRDSLAAGRNLEWALEYVRLNAPRRGRRAREFDERAAADP